MEFDVWELATACIACLVLGFIGGVAKSTKIYVDAMLEMMRRGYVESKAVRGSSQDERENTNSRS